MQARRSAVSRVSVSGFSLVELMIALALGTIIVLGAVGLFITNQRTFQLQQSLTDIQQQGSFTQGFMMTDLRQIGYAGEGGTVSAGVIFGGSGSTDGGADGNDKLTFAFAGTQDCEGNSAGTDTRIVESYWVDANKDLRCSSSLTGSTGGTVLLSGVPSFQVLYGMDVNEDKQAIAGRYVTASVAPTVLTAQGNPAQVVAIRIAFIVQQDSNNPQTASVNRDYMLLDQKLTDGAGVLDADKPQVRREFIITIPVLNYDWTRI
jgi:type IV pilus assembly protein PilW